MKTLLLITIAMSLAAACTWVEEHKGADAIRIISAEQATQCKRQGTINVQVKDKVTFVKRSSKKVLSELQTLARNEAAGMLGVDSLVPETEPQQGEQTYLAYQCF